MEGYEVALNIPRLTAEEGVFEHAEVGVDLGVFRQCTDMYHMAPQAILTTTIAFSAEIASKDSDVQDGYDSETATITLHPLTANMPDTTLQEYRSRAGRNQLHMHQNKYFRERSAVLSRSLAGLLVYRAVDAGFQTEEMVELHANRRIGRMLMHAGAVAGAFAGVFAADYYRISDTTAGGWLTVIGVLGVGIIDAFAVGGSHSVEATDRAKLVAQFAADAAASAPPDLIRMYPPNGR